MKSIVVFFEENIDSSCNYADEKVFNNKSAREISHDWALSFSDNPVVIKADSVLEMLKKMNEVCEQNKADYVIYTYDDLPFLNKNLTEELIKSHVEYCAEYTFADGYPYGFSPEIIDAGTIKILCELAEKYQSNEGNKKVARDSIFNLIKTEINSFEIETVLSPVDFRLYRFNFHCGKKENFIACKNLFESYEDCKKKNEKIVSAEDFSKLAVKNPGILKTVPGFYNVQIADNCRGKCIYCPYPACYEKENKIKPENSKKLMAFNDFSLLIDKIAAFSENAVVSLSAWGEPFNHPELLKFIEKVLSYDGLSVFLETDGMNISDDFCRALKNIVDNVSERKNGWQKVMIAVSIDAFTKETYKKLHGIQDDFDMEKVIDCIKKLSEVIPGSVYPQFLRINDNESELESFFRYWNEKSNQSGGNQIIQKYDDFAKLLPECKPADLSPIERNVCWHLRRDMTILTNGNVPFCREYVLSEIIGNVFTDELQNIWKKTDSVLMEQMNNQYNNKCRNCDEYYTYNF